MFAFEYFSTSFIVFLLSDFQCVIILFKNVKQMLNQFIIISL